MKKFFKVVGYPQPRVFWIAREILSNFDFLRGEGEGEGGGRGTFLTKMFFVGNLMKQVCAPVPA